MRSTVGRFLTDVDYKKLPVDAHTLLVGKFLEVGQARVDALIGREKADRKSPRSDADSEVTAASGLAESFSPSLKKRAAHSVGCISRSEPLKPDSTKMRLKRIFCTGLGALFICAALMPWNGRAAEKEGGFVAYPGVPGATGPVVFSHRAHGLRGAGYACDKCHASSNKALNITMDDIRNGQACGSCHDGRTKGPRSQTAAASIQDCSACHMPAADIVITLNRMDPVAFSHIRHLAMDPN